MNDKENSLIKAVDIILNVKKELEDKTTLENAAIESLRLSLQESEMTGLEYKMGYEDMQKKYYNANTKAETARMIAIICFMFGVVCLAFLWIN